MGGWGVEVRVAQPLERRGWCYAEAGSTLGRQDFFVFVFSLPVIFPVQTLFRSSHSSRMHQHLDRRYKSHALAAVQPFGHSNTPHTRSALEDRLWLPSARGN